MLLNAAIATKFPGHDRLACIWEFVDRKHRVLMCADNRPGQCHGSCHIRDQIDKSDLCGYTRYLDWSGFSLTPHLFLFSCLGAIARDTCCRSWEATIASRDPSRTRETGLGCLDLSTQHSATVSIQFDSHRNTLSPSPQRSQSGTTSRCRLCRGCRNHECEERRGGAYR